MKKAMALVMSSVLLLCILSGCTGSTPAAPGATTPNPSPVLSAPPTSAAGQLNTPENGNAGQPSGTPSVSSEPDSSDGNGAVATHAAAAANVMLDSLDNVFAFADASGGKLITIETREGIKDPERFVYAVGNNGEIISIDYIGWQDEKSGNTSRDTAENFDNLAGYIYAAKNGGLVPDKTYFLISGDVFSADAFVPLKSTLDTSSDTEYYLKVDGETVKTIESLKNRKVVSNDLLSETVDGAKICLFVFERLGDDMLASLAYIKSETVLFMDYPAKYDENSTWRVDAGDEPGLFEVLFLANSDEGLLLGITWAAPEGEGSHVLKKENGAFRESDLNNGRYWNPI